MNPRRLRADGGSGRRSKVARVIDDYSLTDLEDELVSLWTGEGEERYSLRELEQYLNHRILRSAMRDAGMDPIMGEVENLYELLTDSDTSEGVRVEATARLEREGVDVDAVRSDFVSHQSIHTYLKNERDASYERVDDPADRRSRANDTILSLQNRTEAVTRGTLESLRNTETVALGDFDVFVDVRVTCEECGRYYSADELIDLAGCECRQTE